MSDTDFSMSEQEWDEETDASTKLEFLPGEISERKLMMFAATCCKRMGSLVTDHRLLAGIECVQRLPEGNIQPSELQHIISGVWEYYHSQLARQFDDPACGAVIEALERDSQHWPVAHHWVAAVSSHVKCAIVDPLIQRGEDESAWAEEQREQCLIVSDIFGNPFRPVSLDQSWRTSTIQAIAKQMYDSHDFSPMPILADALQDSGCENEDILSHCRGDGPHVRGCWVVDLILGKE